jgi:hypothetical protein
MNMNRSRAASGSGYVPSCSIGFCVARTKKRLRQLVRLAGDGHFPLLHGLQQGRLRLGRRAVDLVGQHDIGEDRPADELERPFLRLGVALDDVGPGDI